MFPRPLPPEVVERLAAALARLLVADVGRAPVVVQREREAA